MDNIHNYSEIPNLDLKKIDPAKDVSEIVEIFNYNVSQIYRWWKNEYNAINDVTTPDVVVVHGINIKGDSVKGDRGNSVYFVDITIVSGEIVGNTKHLLGDIIISGNNIYEVIISGEDLVYSLVGAIGGGMFSLPTSENITSHSILGWEDINNDMSSIISPYIALEDAVKYYRITIGDYKKSNSIGSSLYLTNILEKNNDGSGDLPIDAMSPTSKNFAQLVMQYRKSYDGGVSTSIAYHKFYTLDSEEHYEIFNGNGASISIKNKVDINKWMMEQVSNTSIIDINSDVVRLFDNDSKRMMIYSSQDGSNYYISKINSSVDPYSESTLNIGMRLKAKRISTHTLNGDGGDLVRDIIIKRGVSQERKLEIINLPLNWTSSVLLPTDNTTSLVKDVEIGNKDKYFVNGYYSKYERDSIPENTTDMDQAEHIMRHSLINAMNDSDMTYSYDQINTTFGGTFAERKINLNITTDPSDMVYGRKKTIYVKAYGYSRQTDTGTQIQNTGWFWSFPIRVWDMGTGRMLKYSNGVPSAVIGGGVGENVWTVQNKLPFTDETIINPAFNNTIYPTGTLIGDGASLGKIQLGKHARIYKIDLVFFGIGWAIDNITVSQSMV